jgi:hypothetical protein
MRCNTVIFAMVVAAGWRLAPAQQAAPATPATTNEPAAAPVAAPPAAGGEDRLVVSGNGAFLSQDHGGGGGSLNWLTSDAAGDVGGIGAEYQSIANSHWVNGVLNGAWVLGQSTPKATLYGEAHLGGGDIGAQSFHYTVADGGVVATLNTVLSLQLEERYIDIDTSHGNLPKLGVSLRVTPALLASVSYAYSFGGNLGTKLWTGRLDYVGQHFNWLAGVAYGPVAPSVLNLVGQVLQPGPTLREGFAGIGKRFGMTEWQLLGDYQDLAGFKRTTITLTCTVHLGRG